MVDWVPVRRSTQEPREGVVVGVVDNDVVVVGQGERAAQLEAGVSEFAGGGGADLRVGM